MDVHATRAQGGGTTKVTFDRKPDTCPHCHHGVDPRQMAAASLAGNPTTEGTLLEVAYQCTRRACERMFIGRYRKHGSRDRFVLEGVAPLEFEEPEIPTEVTSVSESFTKIFREAAQAESMGLDEIAGVGYRKALEFLIKDYCIAQDSSDAQTVPKEPLGAVIANRVTDPNIKECAKRAAWLGNDETHYVRRWEDKDIKDLKILIQLTVSWIGSSVLTEQYLKDMAGPAPQSDQS